MHTVAIKNRKNAKPTKQIKLKLIVDGIINVITIIIPPPMPLKKRPNAMMTTDEKIPGMNGFTAGFSIVAYSMVSVSGMTTYRKINGVRRSLAGA